MDHLVKHHVQIASNVSPYIDHRNYFIFFKKYFIYINLGYYYEKIFQAGGSYLKVKIIVLLEHSPASDVLG